jgi:predicted component of type VI protein secretion system
MTATQEELPGVEQEKIPSLERKIKKYQEYKLARMDATKLEVEAKEAVMTEMHNQGLTVYKRPGKFPFKATIKIAGENLKVEEVDEDDIEGESAGEDAEE